MLAIGANIFGLFYNLNPIVVAVICVGIVMALLFYRLKRIHDIAKRKYVQEGQPHEVVENIAEPVAMSGEEPTVPEQGDNISEKSDDLTYLHEESAGTAPSDETIEVAEEPTVPEQVDNVSKKSDDSLYLNGESAGTTPSDETIEVVEEITVPEQGDNISEKSD